MADTMLSKKYTIHHVLKSNQYMNIFVGETKEAVPQKVLLNQWTEKILIQQHLGTILDMKEKGCHDFLECFAEGETLYIVFCYKEGRNLLRYVQTEKLALPYRVVLFQNVLEAFLQWGQHNAMLQFCMLQYHNIVIQNHTIFFNYQLLLLPEEKEISPFAALEQTMQILFTAAERKSMPKLQIIAEKCQKRLYQSLGEMIKELREASGAVEKEKNIQHYMAQRRKALRQKIAGLFFVVLIISIFYIAYDAYKKHTEDTFLYAELENMGTVPIVSQQQSHKEKRDTFVEVKQKEQPPAYEENLQPQKEQETPQQPPDTYVVKAGDNLTRICMQLYQDTAYLQSFAAYNHIENIHLIRPGQVLSVPPKQELQKNTKTTALPSLHQTQLQQQTIYPQYEQESQTDMQGYILLTEEEDYS